MNTDTRPLALQIAALRRLDTDELAARYLALFGTEPERRDHEHLWRAIARRMQADAHGAEDADERRADTRATRATPTDRSARHGRTRGARKALGLGVILTREWRGREIVVRVVEGGFEHEGVVYRSLTAVARHVTGSHWSGPLFFGLRERRR